MLRQMERKWLVSAFVMMLVIVTVCLSACSQSQSTNSSEPDYADDKAMTVIAQGYQKRADLLDELEKNGEDIGSSSVRKKAVQTEIENDKQLKNAKFKDSKMQEEVLAYLNLLDDQLDVLKSYSETDADYYEEWDKVYDKRSAQLKKLVDQYDLEVEEKYKDSFEEIIKNGRSVQEKTRADDAINQLISSANFEKTDNGYGWYTYTAVIENTSDITFKDVGIALALYDADDVRADESFANTNSWAPGEKVKFEASSDTDASRIVPSVSYYDTED